MKRNLSEISKKARIIFFLTEIRTFKEFLLAAHELDLLGGEYVNYYTLAVLNRDVLNISIYEVMNYFMFTEIWDHIAEWIEPIRI